MDVLNRQARICLIEPDGSAVCPRREVNEFLKVLSTRRRRRALGEFEYQIEDLADVLGEIGNVVVETAVIASKETDWIVLKRHELVEVGGGLSTCWKMASNTGPAALARPVMSGLNSPSKSPRNSRVFSLKTVKRE